MDSNVRKIMNMYSSWMKILSIKKVHMKQNLSGQKENQGGEHASTKYKVRSWMSMTPLNGASKAKIVIEVLEAQL
jgi:hypothetical protein